MDKQSHIIEIAERLFSTYGIKSITIDELCEHAGISKKTFYVYYENKDQLVTRVFEKIIKRLSIKINSDREVVSDGPSAVEQQKRLLRRIAALKPLFNDKVLNEHGIARSLLLNFMELFLRNVLEQEINKGIQGGWYRSEVPAAQVAELFLMQIRMVLNYQPYSLEAAIQAHELTTYGLLKSLSCSTIASS
ncbi:TetR/AcrR family transcriptional regulator [Mucilaginibacter phyllosphaerae]